MNNIIESVSYPIVINYCQKYQLFWPYIFKHNHFQTKCLVLLHNVKLIDSTSRHLVKCFSQMGKLQFDCSILNVSILYCITVIWSCNGLICSNDHWNSLCAMIESLVYWPGHVRYYCIMIHSHAWLGPPVQPYSGITGWGRRVAPYWVNAES